MTPPTEVGAIGNRKAVCPDLPIVEIGAKVGYRPKCKTEELIQLCVHSRCCRSVLIGTAGSSSSSDLASEASVMSEDILLAGH